MGELASSIRKLECGKASSQDRFLTEMLKYSVQILNTFHLFMFTTNFSSFSPTLVEQVCYGLTI